MKLQALIKNLEYKSVDNARDCDIKGITCNSRNILPGYLFVAIKGAKEDGHNFLNQAVEKGALALVVETPPGFQVNIPLIIVSDAREALARLSSLFFGDPSSKLNVVGITGTNGKTTIAYLIEHILRQAGFDCGVIGTINYRIKAKEYPAVNTTPQADTLQLLLQEIVRNDAKYAIMEISSHALSQRRVEGVRFAQAIFTNLTSEHLDYHGNLENYFSAKATLFEKLAASAYAIINLDDSYGKRLIQRRNSKVLTYGIDQQAEVRAKELSLSLSGAKFVVVTPDDKFEINTQLIGRHNVYNILAAIAFAWTQKIKPSVIALAVKQFRPVPGRLEAVCCGQEFLTFIDYAHTKDALEKVLSALKPLVSGRIILVFGCGGDRDKAKRPAMGKVAGDLADYALITSDNPRSEDPGQIADSVLAGVDCARRDKVEIVLDRFQAIVRALSLARKQDVVLIAGKGHETEQIFKDKTIYFNDRQAVEKVLRCLASMKS